MTSDKRWTLEVWGLSGVKSGGQRLSFQNRSIERPLNPISVGFLSEAQLYMKFPR